MVKRKSDTTKKSAKKPASPMVSIPKRRRRAPRGTTPSRSSLRSRGVSGDDPSVMFPD